MDITTYQQHGLHRPFNDGDFYGSVINGQSAEEAMQRSFHVSGDRQYHPCPEAYPDDTIPRGTVTHIPDWTASSIYPQTARDMWIYVPDQFDPSGEPPAFMVFNDGSEYVRLTGDVRATNVFDSLIHAGEMPVTIGIFVNPGQHSEEPYQRRLEYDTCTDTYGRFLLEEILPVVADHIGCNLTQNPSRSTLCGISSGGICAFNAAWHFPERFGCVLSHCGSFTNILGGHNYPYLVRSRPRKSIRVFLQSGDGDLECMLGSWPLANQQMAAALDYAGYDYQFAFGEGGHTRRHGGAIFADCLRWLWRD